jgi:hypothetical protein
MARQLVTDPTRADSSAPHFRIINLTTLRGKSWGTPLWPRGLLSGRLAGTAIVSINATPTS